jgi:hypothetical protein
MENATSINQAYPAVVTNDFNHEFYSWLQTPPMGVKGLLHGKEQIGTVGFGAIPRANLPGNIISRGVAESLKKQENDN